MKKVCGKLVKGDSEAKNKCLRLRIICSFVGGSIIDRWSAKKLLYV
jgi:hypothetical protein